MKNIILKNIIIILLVIITSSCLSQKKGNTSTIWINSYKSNCTSIEKSKCLLIQNNDFINDTAWLVLSSKINGFEYQPGFLFKIKVRENKIKKDTSSNNSHKQYTLLEIIEKKTDPKLRLNDIWEMISINGEEFEPLDKNPNMEINFENNRVMGNNGCNNYSGNIKNVGEKNLVFGPISSTKMMCMDMSVANKFDIALANTRTYLIDELTLKLFDKDGNEIIRLHKVD